MIIGLLPLDIAMNSSIISDGKPGAIIGFCLRRCVPCTPTPRIKEDTRYVSTAHLSALVFVLSLPVPFAHAQFAGSRGGNDDASGQMADRSFDPPPLDPKVAVSYITLDGRAEVRVRPSEIRIVLAVTAEAETAQKCQASVNGTIVRLKAAWAKANVPPENIFVDFIAVLPRYTWTLEQREGSEVGVEKKAGYHMQSNVHIAVPDNAQAETALAAAFAEGVTDIIAFDYWSRDLDEAKAKVRQEAVKAARAKADALLTLFEGKLPSSTCRRKQPSAIPIRCILPSGQL